MVDVAIGVLVGVAVTIDVAIGVAVTVGTAVLVAVSNGVWVAVGVTLCVVGTKLMVSLPLVVVCASRISTSTKRVPA